MLVVNSVLICVAIVISYFLWHYFLKCFLRKMFSTKKLNSLTKSLQSTGFSYIMSSDEPLDFMLKMSDVYPSPVQISWGNKFVMIYEPDEVKIILHNKNCLEKTIYYKIFKKAFGMGLLTAPGHIWAKIRTSTAPTFSSHMLRNFFNIFVEESTIFTHKLKKYDLNGNEISLMEHISNCTWKIACDSMMGIKLEPNTDKECVKAMHRLKNAILYRLKSILFFFDVLFYLTPYGRKIIKYVNLIHSAADEMIQRRIHELNNPTTKNDNNRTHRTFFDIWMKASGTENFTQEETHDNVMTMLLTASDTVTVATNFTIFMLANFPDVQEKVYKELFEIYGTETIKSAPIKYEDLQYMRYLDRVIKETMRIFPPVPLIGRETTEEIKIGEVTLPKGANIIINILKIHRNEKYWPNPLMFDPDRFLLEKNDQSYNYMPFSYGPRNCIGMKYGMMSLKVILATLVRTFVFKVNKSIELNEIKLKFDMTLNTEKFLKVKIEER